ncbi:hypothetical protein EDB92DRAFT_236142 [Lactarius akahatsu]|uniref:PH domain-containing protein n=1 Tax=Lactarius akahatsu TaxID=416441 RepID=A0AAD4QF84_9AGAM|nr:hypothetical protein EDB92DRAFT_236142 [Lactarius akahatsu]
MSGAINKAGIKLFARHLEQYTPTDPLYEEYVDKRGRTRRRKRQLPPGLSDRDAAILRSVKRRAHYLDKGFNLCGLRFGWTFIIGIVPGVGDAADAILGYCLVIRKARGADVPWWLTQRMVLNLAIATSIGLVPILGDVLLAAFRANSRNAALLEEFLRVRGEGATRATGESSAPADKGLGVRGDEPRTVHEAGQDTPLEPKRSWLSRQGMGGLSSDADDKGASTSVLPDAPQVVRHRDSRFVEDVT